MDMIERVAKALCEAGPAGPMFNYSRCVAPNCSCWEGKNIQLAKAAIAAMVEPTEGMLQAVAHHVLARIRVGEIGPLPWEDGYRIMIDSILSSPQYVVTEDAPERIKEMISGKG